jgi:hypothetical protein
MTTGSGDMPRTAPNLSIWILAKGRLCARVAIWVLLGTLLLAGRAHAAAPVAEPAGEASSLAEPVVDSLPEASSPSPVSEPTGEASSSTPAEPAPESSSSTTQAAEPVAEPAPEAPPAAESTSEASSASESAPEASSASESASESAPEASSTSESAPEASAPAPVADSAPEASPPAPVADPAPVASTPVEPSKEVKEEPAAEPTKEAKEAIAVEPVLERGESVSSSLPSASQSAATADNPSDSVAEVPGVVAGPVTMISSVAPEEIPTGSACVAALTRTIAAQRAEDFTRELGGLGASSTDTYTAGFDSPSLISAAFVEELDIGTAARAGTHAGGRSGDSPGGSSPIGPPSEPTPSGTFGGAAGGGSGSALSGVPTFAGHLLPGAPLAMRRLRLSFQPWLTAFFVLIPERPG